ncbi:hypothetical protein JW865_08905 [Candidatus Bathyarchaeota archaeon]|nr:hypothetical protein [Candidatus Bathyarchaeota archaeon]
MQLDPDQEEKILGYRIKFLKKSSNLMSFLKNIWLEKQILIFIILSLLFTLLYSQRFIFSPSSIMLGVETSDAFQSLSIVINNLGIINSGYLPFGTFWLFNFYGGSIATFYNVSNIPNIPHSLFLTLNLAFNDPIFWLKIFVFITLLISQLLSYKLAKYYFKNSAIAWLFSICYSFCTFYLSHINDGHLGFILAAAFMPGVILIFEKMFLSANRKNMVYASFSLVALFLSDLQVTIFAIFYLLIRILYHIIFNPFNLKRRSIFKRLFECTIIFILIVAPFLISFTLLQNTEALSVPEIPEQYITSPSLFFLRGSGTLTDGSALQETSLYIGLSFFVLSLLPMFFLNKFLKTQVKSDQLNYFFHLLIMVFFFLIAIGTPLTSLVTTLFVRVPSRTHIIVILSICMCLGYGLLFLNKLCNGKINTVNRIKKNKIINTLLIIGIAIIFFADLTAGTFPVTSDLPELTGGHKFIENQSSDFRILKYPMIWGYTNYESAVIKHEIIGQSVIALRSYPKESELFSNLIHIFNRLDQTQDLRNFTLRATICGVKYILIDLRENGSASYINYFDNATGCFTEVYKDQNSVVYENLYFKGTIFVLKDEGQELEVNNLSLESFSNSISEEKINFTQSYNNIIISGKFNSTAYVVISQSYSPFWINSNDGSNAFAKVLNVTGFQVKSGIFEKSAVFSAGAQTSNLYIIFLIVLILSLTSLVAIEKGKINWFKVILIILVIFGTLNTILALMGTSFVPEILRPVGVFSGVFNTVILLMGISTIIISIIFLIWEKISKMLNLSYFSLKSVYDKINSLSIIRQKILMSCVLIGSLFLIIFTVYCFTSQELISQLYQQVIEGNYFENLVVSGTQLSLNYTSIILLLIAVSALLSLSIFIGQKVLSELREDIVTPKIFELIGVLSLIILVVYVIFNGGLFCAVELIKNQFLWFLIVLFSLYITVNGFIFYDSANLASFHNIRILLLKVGDVSNVLLKFLILVSLTFIILTNLNSVFSEGIFWLNDNIAGILVIILLLYGVKSATFLISEKHQPIIVSTDVFADKAKQEKGIKKVHLGIFGGIIGVCVVGLLMRIITTMVQDYVGWALVLCGALGGLGFGLLTKGNMKYRGIIGCCFGIIAIFFGLLTTYDTPIVIGYMTTSDGLIPLYLWHEMSFLGFVANKLLSMNGVFYTLWGLLLAYLCSSYLSFKHFKKRKI